jgi:hypothetical protein
LLTGRRDNRHHLVEVNGRAAWLTFGEFTNFCALVVALLSKADRACPLGAMEVRRLRLAFDRAFQQEGFGKELIHAASDGEYCLAAALDQIAADASFRELSPLHLDRDFKEVILDHVDRLPRTIMHR